MAADRSSKKIELQSNEIDDMLGRVPGWITRNGIILFLFLLALLIFGSWVLRYPDSKRADIVVTSVNPPADVEARASGKIAELFVNDNEMVETGKTLAMIENPADFKDVIQLKADIAFLDSIRIEEVPDDMAELRSVQLGTIQTNYAMFLKAYKDYIEFKKLNYHYRTIELLRSELGKQHLFTRSLGDRASIAEEEYELVQRQFMRDASLYEESVVSQSDLEASRSEMLGKRNRWQEILGQVAENNITIARTEQQVVDLEMKQQEEQSQMINTLEESLNNLNASIASWEQNYLLVAPVSGTVTFTRIWSENQNVKAGEKVLTIIPTEAGSMLGKIQLPMAGAGKVKIGDQVNIQFDNYPHLQYGMVKGYVSNISKVPDNDYYTVEVELPAGLHTYYDYDISFSQNMQGRAEILTDKLRLLQRVLNPIRSAITKQVEM